MTLLLDKRLRQRLQMGNYRNLQPQKILIDFASNDYLGLARSSDFYHHVQNERKKLKGLLTGVGSTGSRLLTGNSLYAEELEERIAYFHGFETSLLFNCGYMANIGLISAVVQPQDVIFFDIGVHASTYDGIRLSGAKSIPFFHNDLQHLENQIKRTSYKGQRWIIIESLYSTDGSKASLKEICQLAKIYQAEVIVDEAHAVGVCGPQGKGLVAENGLTRQVFAIVCTFGKALGVYGAAILGSKYLKALLINFSRPYIYTTALPLHLLASIKCSYEIFPQLESERIHLNQLITHYQKLVLEFSDTHIQTIKKEGNARVKFLATKLMEEGLDVRALLSPTVRRRHELLRICLHAFNTLEEVEILHKKLNQYTHEMMHA